jgi:hypothetical protein
MTESEGQSHYAKRQMQHGFLNVSVWQTATPLLPGCRLKKLDTKPTKAEEETMKKIPCEAIGSIMYLAVATHPDLAYAIHILTRFMSDPGIEHW